MFLWGFFSLSIGVCALSVFILKIFSFSMEIFKYTQKYNKPHVPHHPAQQLSAFASLVFSLPLSFLFFLEYFKATSDVMVIYP